MKLNLLPASHGIQWLRDAYEVIRNNRWLFICNILLYSAGILFTFVLFLSSPMIFTFMLGVLGVFFNTSIILICEHCSNPLTKEVPVILTKLWGDIFKNKRMLVLALITAINLAFLYLAFNTLASLLFADIFQQSEQIFSSFQNTPDADFFALLNAIRPYLIIQQTCGFLSQAIIFLLFCMTPAIICWTNTTHGKSIFYNLMALFRNWRAWLTWAIVLLLIFAVPPPVLAFILNVTQGSPILFLLSYLIVLILGLGLIFLSMIIVPASYYFAYKDCFIQNQHA